MGTIAQKEIAWKLGMSNAERAETVAVGTNVLFKWSGTHNIWLMPNKAAYDACDFSQATELASISVNEYTYKASAAGTIYFGCQVTGHCSFANHKMTLTVTAAPTTTPAQTTTPATGWRFVSAFVMNSFCYTFYLCRGIY